MPAASGHTLDVERAAGREAPPAEKPKLLFVLSSTCGRSRKVESFLAQVLQRRKNHQTFDVVRIDAAGRDDLIARLGVTDIPTLLVLEHGQVRATLGHPSGSRAIAEFLGPWLH